MLFLLRSITSRGRRRNCKKEKNGEKLNEKPLDVKFSNFIKMGKNLMGQKRSSAHTVFKFLTEKK